MTDITPSAAELSVAKTTGGAFYRLVWKWHFLAALYVLPFMAMLAITGGIYVWKPQIESAIHAELFFVEVSDSRVPLAQQISAVEAEAGITRMRGVMVWDDATRTTRIEFNDADRTRSYAWVNPYTGEVLGVRERDAMPMRVLRKLHSELLLGDFGTKFVELAAHWAIVMFITGAFLWWPRGQRSLSRAVSLPKGRGRAWWRETHLFTGMLATILVVPILISGLPWTDVWGGGLSAVQRATGQESQSLRFGGDVPNSTASEGETIPLEQVLAVMQSEGLVAPYEMRPPRDNEAAFWVRSAHTDRNEQTELIIDQYTGEVLTRHAFADNPIVARTVSQGISLHQGELYGTLNQIVNSIAATLAVMLSVSGFVAWWMRRPKGALGVPEAPETALGIGMIVLIIGLALLFPLMGASLILALALDWLVFRRLGWFRGTHNVT